MCCLDIGNSSTSPCKEEPDMFEPLAKNRGSEAGFYGHVEAHDA